MEYAHSLTVVNRKLKTGYLFAAPPGWSLRSSGFNSHGQAEVTLTLLGPYVPESPDLPDGWEVAGWFRQPVRPKPDPRPDHIVTAAFVLGIVAGSAISLLVGTVVWLIQAVWG